MANTTYQRQVKDLQRAGINPALAYINGVSGQTAPSGRSASGRSASVGGYQGQEIQQGELANIIYGLGQIFGANGKDKSIISNGATAIVNGAISTAQKVSRGREMIKDKLSGRKGGSFK